MKTVYTILALLSLSFLVGCGQKSADSGSKLMSEREAAAEPRSTTRDVIDANGETVSIPSNPQNILVLSELDLDALLALDIKPAMTTNGRGQSTPPRYLGEKADGLTIVGDFARPNLDKVIELAPDLILVGGYVDEQIYAKLSKIAPTVYTYTLQEDWKAALTRIGKILGKDQEAIDFLNTYEARCQEVIGKLGSQKGATISITRWNPKGPAYMYDDSFAATVVGDLGFTRPEAQRHPGKAH